MTVTSYPGVYMEEVSGGVRPIQAAGTSTAAFFGVADRGPIGKVTKIFAFDEFLSLYGGFRTDGQYLAHGVYHFFGNGGRECYVGRVSGGATTATATLADRSGDGRPCLGIAARTPGASGSRLRARVTSDPAAPGRFTLAILEVVRDAAGHDQATTLETFAGVGMDPAGAACVVTAADASPHVKIVALDNAASAGFGSCTSGVLRGKDGETEWVAEGSLALCVDLHGDGERSIDIGAALGAGDRSDLAQVAEAIRATVAALAPLGDAPDIAQAYAAFKVGVEETGTPDERVLRLESGLKGVGSTLAIRSAAAGESLTGALKLDAAGGMVAVPGSAPMCPADSAAALGTPLAGGSDTSVPRTAEAYAQAFAQLDRITDVSLIAVPGVGLKGLASAGMAYCRNRSLSDCFFIADLDENDDTREDALTWSGQVATPNSYGAAYFPWLRTNDPSGLAAVPIAVPPSGFVAGLYAQTDYRRGVWKAPAGTEAALAGALDTVADLTNQEHGDLNLPPVSVCAIRKMPGAGIVIWGARTMSSDAEYKYIPVRRTAILLRKSIHDGIQWAVFEGNDERLWASLRLNIGSFMNGLFRAGAFQGGKASDAYFVRCGLGDTMTQADIDRGEVIVLVGFAPLKPAEFVIVRIQQKVGQA